jgi:hypothetical protein
LEEEQYSWQRQKRSEEKSMGFPVERFVFSNCFGLERPRFERCSAILLGTALDFILIALYQFFQDWSTVKGRTTILFQRAADHRLISENRGL